MTDGPLKRIILEMGSGNDLHGGDYTKAAKRAVQDALHHSSLILFRTLEIDPDSMRIELTLAAQEPEKIDVDSVAATLPYGEVTARAIKVASTFRTMRRAAFRWSSMPGFWCGCRFDIGGYVLAPARPKTQSAWPTPMMVRPKATVANSQAISQPDDRTSAPRVATVTKRTTVTVTGKAMRPVP